MQYTLRNVPKHVDAALRRRARSQRKSLNQVAIEALARATGEAADLPPLRDLSDIVGTWVEDSESEKIFEEFRRVDPGEWR